MRVLRVGQLDSELLDQELISLLQQPIQSALSQVSTSLHRKFQPEITLFIQLVLYRFSVWNHGASYGAKLQGLRYVHRKSNESGIPKKILAMHGALTVILPYIHSRIRAYGLSRAWPDAPSSDRRRKAWEWLVSLESSYSALGLISFVAFLWNGHFRSIADRIFNMRLVPSHRLVTRDVSYEFMNRQMVWHAFTEFLLFFLPLVNHRKLQRRFNQLASAITTPFSAPSTSKTVISRGKYHSLSENQCPICAENASLSLNNLASAANATSVFSNATAQEEDPEGIPSFPIYTPYITSCGHIYCYHCIADRMLRSADESGDTSEGGWECLRCAETVTSADRYLVEFGEDVEIDDEFEFDFSPTRGSDDPGFFGRGRRGSDYDFNSDLDLESESNLSESFSVGYTSLSGLSSSED
ncbi:peroxisome assembly protein (Peroxin-2) [Stygiomarasmius scandens]|uniref:RING-type E3 ubiquitin transferase (cysteine targeting) n=1 Tax=Marasmiellus scandens TaxID=2682957 RepID=A0ABR1K0T7_9AGAR